MKKLTIFSVNNRIEVLENFLDLSQRYFSTLVVSHMGETAETETSYQLRSEINALVGRVERYVRQSDTTQIFYQQGGQALGGQQRAIQLIPNIFAIQSHHISPLILFDTIERALADYRNDITYAWIRTFNPFYWFACCIQYVSTLPFQLLTSVGFNGEGAQHSLIGRFIMLVLNSVMYLISALSGISTILGYINTNDSALSFLKKIGVL